MEEKAEDFIKSICDLQGIPPFTQKMTFFYDETGNCRKFSLKNGCVNSFDAIEKDFILGGIAFDEEKFPNVDKLFSKLVLQPTQKELKYKHFQGKDKSFIDIIGSKRITILLDWLIECNAYIHFSTLNNLYYSLVDLVDALFITHPEVFPLIEKGLKSSLYRFIYKYRDYLLPFLSKYDYPNISRENVKEFSYELANFIQSNNDDSTEEGFYLETFRQMLKTAGKSGELVFLQDNESEILIKEYYLFYRERYTLFPDSTHIFDEESTIQKKLKSITTTYKGKVLNNYQFVKSTENKFIQLSDVFVGLLGQLFYFLDTLTIENVKTMKKKENETGRNNIRKVGELINRSNHKSPFFIKNCNDVNLIRERERKIDLLSRECMDELEVYQKLGF